MPTNLDEVKTPNLDETRGPLNSIADDATRKELAKLWGVIENRLGYSGKKGYTLVTQDELLALRNMIFNHRLVPTELPPDDGGLADVGKTIVTGGGTPGPKGDKGDKGDPGEDGIVAFGGAIAVTMVGGGSGGSASTATAPGGGGGSSGESIEGEIIYVAPGSTVSYSVGAGGGPGASGGDTTFGILKCLGGVAGSGTAGGTGGGARGGVPGAQASPNGGTGIFGNPETATYFAGSGGGGGGLTTTSNGGYGGGGGGYLVGGTRGAFGGGQAGGGGGAATIYGPGGNGGDGGLPGASAAATAYGAGGGGGGGKSGGVTGGSGTGGYILVTYFGGSVEFTSGSGTWTAPL